MSRRYRTIVIDDRNYRALKACGQAGDSFNDVVSRLVAKEMQKEADAK